MVLGSSCSVILFLWRYMFVVFCWLPRVTISWPWGLPVFYHELPWVPCSTEWVPMIVHTEIQVPRPAGPGAQACRSRCPGLQVQVPRPAGPGAQACRSRCPGLQVQVPRPAGPGAQACRFRCPGLQVQVPRPAGSGAQACRSRCPGLQVQVPYHFAFT